jgi:hypothetical protein
VGAIPPDKKCFVAPGAGLERFLVRTRHRGCSGAMNPLGDDLLPWLLLALGAALALGTGLALFRPPPEPGEGDLARPPLARSLVMIFVGLVAAVWGLATLLT